MIFLVLCNSGCRKLCCLLFGVRHRKGQAVKYALMFTVLLVLGACSPHPDSIPTAYVSPLKYQSYSCQNIRSEIAAITSKNEDLYANLKRHHNRDRLFFGLVFISFEFINALGGERSLQEVEYYQLKGELDALSQAGEQKNCNIEAVS